MESSQLRPAGVTGSGFASEMPAQEVTRRLMVTPQLLRALCDEYSDMIRLIRRDGRTYLDTLGFSRLQLILHWRNKGLAAEEIRRRLTGAEGAGWRVDDGDPVDRAVEEAAAQDSPVLARLEQLATQLQESERHRLEDRDRLMTALMRTQRDMQKLRSDFATPQVRQRKGHRSLLRRLFGRA